MGTVTSPTNWIGRALSSPGLRGAVGGVRERHSVHERRLRRQLVLGAVAVLAVALLLVWIRLQVVHTGYALSAARQLEGKLEVEQRELEIEIATLASPRRLEERARGHLGMRPPAPGEVVSLP